MLTRAGWAVAVGAIAGALGGRLFGVTELFVLATVAGALVVIALAWVRRPAPHIEVERRVHPDRIAAGTPARVEVRVTNRGARRTAPLFIADPVEGTVGARMAVGPLAAGARQDVGYRLPVLRRGLFHLGPLTTEVIDPFGLARRTLPGKAELAITVLPAIDPAPLLPLGGGRHEPLAGLGRRVVAASGVEDLVTLRPYVVGDDLRRVHWPSSAHADELQVRRDEERWQGHLTVLIDTRAGVLRAPDFERALSAAAGIIDAVATSGDRIRVATTGGMDSGMVDAQRDAHRLLEDLALLTQDSDARLAPPQAEPRRPVTLIVLTAHTDAALTDAIGARSSGFVDLVVVCFGDDHASAASDRMVSVGPDEPFATAWHRTAATGARR